MTYNVKLNFESEDDENRLLATLEAQKLAFNEGSKLFYDPKHTFGSKVNGIKELHNLFYRKFRDENPIIPAQIVIRAEQDILSAYRSIKANKHKIIAAPQKKRLSMRLDKRLYSYDSIAKTFKFTALGGTRITASLQVYPKALEMLETYSFADPLVFYRNGNIYITLTFNTPEVPLKSNSSLGVDLGIKRIYATSSGEIFKDKSYNARKRQVRHLKSCLKSKGSKSAERHLKKLRFRERNQQRDFLQKTANRLLQNPENIFVLENLNFKKLKTANKKKGVFGKRLNNRLSQISFAEFRRILEYKALTLGKRVVTVNPYMTSQEDNRGLEKGKRQGCRYYASDGQVLDADINAAKNINSLFVNKGRQAPKKPSRQAAVKQPIVQA